MELRQRLELRKLLAPELRQSLKILTLPLLDLKNLIEDEMLNNPLLEEVASESVKPESNENINALVDSLLNLSSEQERPGSFGESREHDSQKDTLRYLVAEKSSLRDILMKQLGIFADNDEEIYIGNEIIGNIDENGYLKASIEEICISVRLPREKVESVLEVIQRFEPPGVGARSLEECLLIQLKFKDERDVILNDIIRFHLDEVAKKDFKKIARALNVSQEQVKDAVLKISLLDPKPGRNFSAESIHQIIPDVTIEEDDKGGFVVFVRNEMIPRVIINRSYAELLKHGKLDVRTQEFLLQRMRRAQELLRAVSKRQGTLRRVVEKIVEIQAEALREGFECLKPLTFRDISRQIHMHETTVCRVVMNKYAQTQHGMVALRDFFPSRIRNGNNDAGEPVSSELIKSLIMECVEEEDKCHPVSDQEIVKKIYERRTLKVARRTVAKYREELKILSSPFRRQR